MRPTIDQMCKGLAGANIRQTIENANALKRLHRFQSRGYSPKKTLRFIGAPPEEIQLRKITCMDCYNTKVQGRHLDWNQNGLGCKACNFIGKIKNEYYNYFQPGMDKHERTKHRYDFYRKFPQFSTVDKT